MQNAQREQNDNDDEEMCEFVTMAEDGATPSHTAGGASAYDGDETLKAEGDDDSQNEKTKE